MAIVDFDWLLEDPRVVLSRLIAASLPVAPTAMVLASALISLAVADAWMVPSFASMLPRSIILYVADVFVWIFLISRLSRLWPAPRVSWRSWWRSGAVALAPFHLALPAALLCKPFHGAGFLLYESVKLALAAVVLRRWVLIIEGFNNWPTWGAALLVVVPVLVGIGMLVAAVLFGAGIMAIAVLAGLR